MPSVPRPARRWKTRVLVPGVILLTAAALLLYTAREALRPAIPVRVVPVVQREVDGGAGAEPGRAGEGVSSGEVVAQAAGWIEADPFPVNVSALAEGVVREVLVLEGDVVEAGDVVARLVDDDARLALGAAEADVARRAAEVAIAEADLAAAQSQWDNPVERTRALASAEAMLAKARAELARHPADVAAEEARLAEVRDELERKSGLIETGAVSSGEIAGLERRVAAQAAAVEALRGVRGSLEAVVRQAEAEAAAAREGLRLRIEETRGLAAARGTLEQARAMLAGAEAARDGARLRLDRMEVRTPVSGVVLSRLAAPGTWLMPGGGVAGMGEAIRGDSPMSGGYAVRLYDPQRLQVRVDVPLVDAGKVSVGAPAEVTVEVLPGRTLRGRITRVLGEANIQKNTLQVKVAIEDPPAELRPEMLARVRFFGGGGGGGEVAAAGESGTGLGTGAMRLFVPRAALVNQNGTSARVWTADRVEGGGEGGGRASLREVMLGSASVEDWVEAASGVRPGDLIIVGDTSRLREGARVRIGAGDGDGGSTP